MPEPTTLSLDDIQVIPPPADAHFYTGDRDPNPDQGGDPLVPVNNRTNGDLMY
jgi:hypothetical protein